MVARPLALRLLAPVLLAVAACAAPPEAPPPAQVPAAVAAYTAGTVSREVVVRVQFTAPMVEQGQVGTPLEDSPFSSEPGIDGVAVWSDRQTLELRPRQALAPGRVYVLELPLERFTEVSAGEKVLRFGFTVMRQSFDLRQDGLEAVAEDSVEQLFRGTVTTADVAEPADVEAMVEATFAGKTLAVEWTHDGDRRRHAFAVKGITRAERDAELVVSWDGGPIGAEGKDELRLRVAGLSTFAVSQVRAVNGDEQYIEVRFTDALDRKQSLAGLVSAGPDRPRLATEGSVLRIYGRARFGEHVDLAIEPGVKSFRGFALKDGYRERVAFAPLEPAVRFGSKGVFLPTTDGLTIPLETANLRAVVVEAIRVPEQNIPQFLQVNAFDTDRELHRVGRVVWREVVDLGAGADSRNRWARYGLDVRPLVTKNPGGLYRLRVSFARPHILYDCPAAAPAPVEEAPDDDDFDAEADDSYWDAAEEYGGMSYWQLYEGRRDPCHPGFYRGFDGHRVEVTRNVLVTDVGLVAKVGSDNSIFVAASDVRTAEPLAGAEIQVLDFQQQVMARGKTGGDGTLRLEADHRPFVVVASSGEQRGFVKLDDGSALAVAHFDVSGAAVTRGIKGKLFGERGVWRPGDDVFLTFVLFDPEDHVPADHPLRFELVDPRGRIVEQQTRRESVNGFYAFRTKTAPDAPTGGYTARVRVGGATFEQPVRIETVRPNRLAIGLDFHTDVIRAGQDVHAALTSTWLHGALARHLRADVRATLERRRTSFPRYAEYEFDDPMRRFETESSTLFEGTLDEKGEAAVTGRLEAAGQAPGMLTATFSTRVFESSGAYSSDSFSVPFSPYPRYIGVRTPKGDAARGMLLTDTRHPVQLVALGPDGKPTAGDVEVEVKLYKVSWRWWWEKGEDTSLADYVESRSHQALATGTVTLKNGEGTWDFQIAYPDWGRYLVVARDLEGGHRSGRIFYCDWPGWAGRAQKDNPGGAAVLAFAADAQEYQVGERVTLTIPTAAEGRALVSIESGSKVLQAEWLEARGGETRYAFTATSEMAPNVYAHVTLVQPHLQARNDLPIRMYGVIPIAVVDPASRLAPVIETADVLVPESSARIRVKEAKGRPMTYTLAVVDEGLLGLTRFQTPRLWDHFYRREALGVRTWDVYDLVAGAYGASLERLLAIGGDDELGQQGGAKANRFPPMVRFMGPFALAGGDAGEHTIDVPRYVGAVRVMVVAGQGRAFGSAEKSVFVRKPLLVLATLPRVLGPEERVDLPVSVFALEEKVRSVRVRVTTSGPVALRGPAERNVSFGGPGDRTIDFGLVVKREIGRAKIDVVAEGGGERAAQTIEIDVRMPGVRVTDVVAAVVEAGRSWRETIAPSAFAGTATTVLEVSRVPPVDLGRRLDYLVHYPHGCVEQTTSGAFPQLYLSELLDLSPARKAQIEANIRGGIERLRAFQAASGGFGYWPGEEAAGGWATTYAGHFLLEARRAGYLVQDAVVDQWKRFQRNRASTFSRGSGGGELDQAYRLYTLALAGAPELGAMNRLKESGPLPPAALWRLAAAYQLAGKPELARELTRSAALQVKPYQELAGTYGSDLRDEAMILETLWLMNEHARGAPLARELSQALSGERPLSTQELSFALIAMARYAAAAKGEGASRFAYSIDGGAEKRVETRAAVVQEPLRLRGEAELAVDNRSDEPLFVRVISAGVPAYGTESDAENGLRVRVAYQTSGGAELDPEKVEQGSDLVAAVTVTNTSARGKLDEIALSHLVPAGWELRNVRVEGGADGGQSAFDYQDLRDDRVYTYFDLGPNESRTFRATFNASYTGRFYLPLVSAEAMYDGTVNGRAAGRWIEVVRGGTPVAAAGE